MRVYFIIIFLFIAMPSPSLLGQGAVIDSLRSDLEIQMPDTSRVLTLCRLAHQLYAVDPTESKAVAVEAIELAEKINYNKGVGKGYYQLAVAEISLGNKEATITAGKKSLEIALAENDRSIEGYARTVLGVAYTDIGDFDRAVVHLEASLELAEGIGDKSAIASSCNALAKVYQSNAEPELAVNYLRRTATLLQELGNEAGYLFSLNNLAICVGDPAEEKALLLEAIQGAENIKNDYLLQFSYANYAKYLFENEDSPLQAIAFYHKQRPIALKFGDPYILVNLYYEMGRTFRFADQLDSARWYLEKALPYSGPDKYPDIHVNILHELALSQAESGDYQSAYTNMKNSFVNFDSLQLNERNKLLANADARYQLSEKEASIATSQLEIQRQKVARNRMIIGVLVFVTLLAGIFQYLFYRQRQRKAAVDLALEAEARETARLRELDKMKTQFFTNVSHELRTPLTLITSPLEQALGKLKQTNLQPNLELAHRNSQQLLGLVNEMLDLAKLETGTISLEKSTQPIEPWLRRIFYSFQSAAEGKNLSWDYELSPSAVANVETDFPKLEKILNNLLSNALKFTPAGGRVALSGICEEGKLSLQVTDNGPGISPEELPRIFERFYQSPNLSATGGTGIGLALSRRLARLLNGGLTASSKLGEGSRFELVIPVVTSMTTLVPEEDTITAEVTESAPVPVLSLTGDRPRLLIVEDHPEMSLYLRQSLVQEYDSVVAENGAKALELMAGQPFDLVLSDVMMPVMDGFALREKINEVPEWAGTPFIFLTARTLESDKLRGFQLGVDDYVTKPFQLAELKARMQSLLRNKTRRKEHAVSEEAEMDNEQQLLDQAEQLVRNRLDDLTFTVEELARELGYSQRQLSRVFGRLAGLTPVQFVLEVRLQHARHLLETGQHGTVAEVRYAIGIESASYFTRKFKERFGRNPRTYFEVGGS